MATANIFICGNFGFRTGQVDGQTIKTRVLRDALADALGRDQVKELDSSRLLSAPFQFLHTARSNIRDSGQSIMLPGSRGLQLFLPFFLHWKTKFKKPLQYVVVGGWLPQLLETKPWLRRLCARLDGIYVETAAMAEALKQLGLQNVEVMPNFRKFDRHANFQFPPVSRPLKLVFYSRVIREKGIEEAIAAVAQLNRQDSTRPLVTLDVYGPIAGRYQETFQALIHSVSSVRYCGVLSPDAAPQTLRTYDMMLFPTYYEGEGFPGAVLDAYIAGVPVIASDWKYNREVVLEGKTGVFCRSRSVEDLMARIQVFISEPERIMPMRQHCVQQAKHYHVDIAIRQLLQAGSQLSEDRPSKRRCHFTR